LWGGDGGWCPICTVLCGGRGSRVHQGFCWLCGIGRHKEGRGTCHWWLEGSCYSKSSFSAEAIHTYAHCTLGWGGRCSPTPPRLGKGRSTLHGSVARRQSVRCYQRARPVEPALFGLRLVQAGPWKKSSRAAAWATGAAAAGAAAPASTRTSCLPACLGAAAAGAVLGVTRAAVASRAATLGAPSQAAALAACPGATGGRAALGGEAGCQSSMSFLDSFACCSSRCPSVSRPVLRRSCLPGRQAGRVCYLQACNYRSGSTILFKQSALRLLSCAKASVAGCKCRTFHLNSVV
jgi:hypothetical protein